MPWKRDSARGATEGTLPYSSNRGASSASVLCRVCACAFSRACARATHRSVLQPYSLNRAKRSLSVLRYCEGKHNRTARAKRISRAMCGINGFTNYLVNSKSV